MRTVDPAKHEAKRLLILDAAAALFAQKGFERTTTADICARAGISTGALFHYFPNKRAIFLAIFEQDTGKVAAYVADAAGTDDPLGAVFGLIDLELDGVENPEYAGLALEVFAHANRDEEFAALLGRQDREREGLVGLLEQAARKGQIDASLDPAAAARWISALVDSVWTRNAEPGFVAADELRMLRLIITRFLQAEPR